MNFTEHTFLWNRVFELLEEFTYRPCPHVHIVLQDCELPLTKLSMHRNRILYFLSTINDLLTKHTKSTRSLDPLVSVSFDLLNGRPSNMLRFRVGRGERRGRSSWGTWCADCWTLPVFCDGLALATRCYILSICLGHSTSRHIKSFGEFTTRLGSCCCICGAIGLLTSCWWHSAIVCLQASVHWNLSGTCHLLFSFAFFIGTGGCLRLRLSPDILNWLTSARARLSFGWYVLDCVDDWGEELLRVHGAIETRRRYGKWERVNQLNVRFAEEI